MVKYFSYLTVVLMVSCGQNTQFDNSKDSVILDDNKEELSRIAFGSCNNAYAPNATLG